MVSFLGWFSRTLIGQERHQMKIIPSNSNMGLSPIDVISEIILPANDLSEFIKSFGVKPFGNLIGMAIQATGLTNLTRGRPGQEAPDRLGQKGNVKIHTVH